MMVIRSSVCWLVALGVVAPVAAALGAADQSEQARPNRILIEYVPPQNQAHQDLYERLKEKRVLEMAQRIFSPFRLTVDLTIRIAGCEGVDNAWYQRPAVTICYEYIEADINQNIPKDTGADGVTPSDAMVGQFIYTVAHEMGHAMFDALNVPLFGRPEDDADQFATYVMLMIGKSEARRLIRGAAHTYQSYVDKQRIIVPVTAFSDEHGAPVQRFYNMLCIAYGAQPEAFADLVDNGTLPARRARGCRREFEELNFAFKQLIFPHIDETLMKEALKEDWLPPAQKPAASQPAAVRTQRDGSRP